MKKNKIICGIVVTFTFKKGWWYAAIPQLKLKIIQGYDIWEQIETHAEVVVFDLAFNFNDKRDFIKQI